MICPHCQTNLLYKERSGKHCSRCRKQFAFEPKTDPLGMHDLRFKRLVSQLSTDGTQVYTPAQLLHHLSHKTLLTARPLTFAGCLGNLFFLSFCGGFLGLMFFSELIESLLGNISDFAQNNPLAFSILALTSLPFILFLVSWFFWNYTRPWRYLKLPLNFADFQKKYLARWKQIYKEDPLKMLTEAEMASAKSQQPPLEQVQAVLVCPTLDVRICLQANHIPKLLGVALLPPNPANFTPVEKSIWQKLQTQPDLPLFLLHSASPEGILLASHIRQKFELRAEHQIIDLGLFPRQIMTHNLMKLGAKPDPATLSSLSKNTPLNEEEVAWLKKGFYGPILGLKPSRLIKIVNLALMKEMPDFSEEGLKNVSTPEKQAQAVGFMTWPSA